MFLAESPARSGEQGRQHDRPTLLTVEPLGGRSADARQTDRHRPDVVCLDTRRPREIVLIVQGSSARLVPELEKLPTDATIVGIVDNVQVENKTIFKQGAN